MPDHYKSSEKKKVVRKNKTMPKRIQENNKVSAKHVEEMDQMGIEDLDRYVGAFNNSNFYAKGGNKKAQRAKRIARHSYNIALKVRGKKGYRADRLLSR